jgi:hypothetical protein
VLDELSCCLTGTGTGDAAVYEDEVDAIVPMRRYLAGETSPMVVFDARGRRLTEPVPLRLIVGLGWARGEVEAVIGVGRDNSDALMVAADGESGLPPCVEKARRGGDP